MREYWIVDPNNIIIETFILDGKKLTPAEIYDTENETINSAIFEGLEIKLSDIFEEQE